MKLMQNQPSRQVKQFWYRTRFYTNKAVLIDQENKPIAQGSHTWENQLVDGL